MKRQDFRGFTLIELMIAVAIVALLTVVALPSYREHVAKSRRAEGRNALLQAAQLQERFYTTRVPTAADPIRYAQTTGATNDFPTLFGQPINAVVYSGDNPADPNGSYQIVVAPPTATCPIASCFVIRATPNGKHAPDLKCGMLTLDSGGTRGENGTETLDYCWGK